MNKLDAFNKDKRKCKKCKDYYDEKPNKVLCDGCHKKWNDTLVFTDWCAIGREMTSIRLVIFYQTPDGTLLKSNEDVNQALEEYLVSNINTINSPLNSFINNPGFVVKNFEIPETLDKDLITDICNGKSMKVWIEKRVMFEVEFYQSWIFTKNKKDDWELFGTDTMSH